MNRNPGPFLPAERTLLRWGVVAFALVGALVVGLFTMWQMERREAAVAQVVARVETLADARKHAVRAWLRERQADAQVLAWDPDLIEMCIEGSCPKGLDPTRLLSHLENNRFFSGFRGAYLFTPSGVALLAAEGGVDPPPEANVKARQAARERRFLLHDLHRAKDGTPVIGFLAPVFHQVDPQARREDAPVLGVVGIYLDPRETLFPTLAGAGGFGWESETYLVRPEEGGVRLLSDAQGAPPAPGTGLLALPGDEALEHSAAVDGERSGRFPDFRNVRVLAAVRWISEAGWGLVAKVDEDRGLAAWRRESRVETLLLGTLLLCLLLGGVAAWRWWSGNHYRLLLEGVRDREERLRALAQGSDDLVFLKDTGGRYLLVNPVAAEMLGTSADEAVGRRASDFLNPAVSGVLEAHDREVLETGVSFHGEEVLPHRGGSRTYLSSRVPIRDSRGDLQGVAGVLRDITERKRDELALVRWAQTLEELYRLSRELTAAPDLGTVYELLLDGVVEALGADVAVLYVAEGVGGDLTLTGGRKLPPGFAERHRVLASDEGLAREMGSRGGLLAVPDCTDHSAGVVDFAAEAGIISLLAVPLRGTEGLPGLLALGFVAPREFRSDEGEALALLGQLAVVAAGRCRALASLAAEADVRRRAEERLRRFHASTAGLTGQELFERVAGTVAEELGAKLVLVSKVTQGGVAAPYAAVSGGAPTEYAPYPLAATPCQATVGQARLVHFSGDVQQHFPGNSFLSKNDFVSYVGVPLEDSEGGVVGLLCAFHDGPMSLDDAGRDLLELYALRLVGEMERLVAEDRLSEARRALDTLIENLPGAVYRSAWRPDRPLQFVSAGVRVVSGYGPEQLLGDGAVALGDLVVAEDRSRVWREIQLSVAESRPYEVEYRIHDPGGQVRWVYDVGTPVWTPDGGDLPSGLEGVLFDHTERRSLEAQLTHSQRMDALGRLAGGVAHDFNNLLTAISGYSELLIGRLPDDPRAQKAAGEVLKATDRAAELTRQLLAFGRRQIVEPKLVELDELVAHAARMLERLIGEDICFSRELDAAGATVRVDPGQVEQVLFNLVVNARDAMPGGGDLTLRTLQKRLAVEEQTPRGSVPPGEYVGLEVVDTGPGMEPELLERVFDPFFTTKDHGEGSGLGLAAVYGAVRQAGGYITVASAPGEGTTFRVLWPRCGSEVAVEPAVTAGRRPSLGEGEVVLLVEDEVAVRDLAAEHLTGLGYRVSAFGSGVEAVAGLDGVGPVAALITDVVMPGMRGTELARTARERRPGLPVVFISGHAGDTLGEIELGDSGTTFLQKPFRLSDLEQALRRVLDISG